MPSERMTPCWLHDEEVYLRDLSNLCELLSTKFKRYYEIYKKKQARFKIPAIIISSITGLTSLGTSSFPPNTQQWIAIGVGATSLFIAILNSIESYMKIGETMSGCLQASISLQKLKEAIDLELAVPADDRNDPGITFLRECYSKYEKIIELAPSIIQNIKFVRPAFETNRGALMTTLTNKPTSQADIEKGVPQPVTSEIFEEESPTHKPRTIFLT
jgi:hypothetical protein